jgi:diguanylate cyclase (GGDEF)-like protein
MACRIASALRSCSICLAWRASMRVVKSTAAKAIISDAIGATWSNHATEFFVLDECSSGPCSSRPLGRLVRANLKIGGYIIGFGDVKTTALDLAAPSRGILKLDRGPSHRYRHKWSWAADNIFVLGRHIAKRPERPPIDPAWQWHLQLSAERLFSSFRFFVISAITVCWLFGIHPPGSRSPILWMIIVLAFAFAAANVLVLKHKLPIAELFPFGSVLADWALIAVGLWASGGRSSPFQILIVVGVVATSLRLSVKPAIAFTFAYIALLLLFGEPNSLAPNTALIAILGIGVATWSELMKRQHIAAVRDPLTGAYSRDFGLFRLHQVLANGPFPIVVAVLDIDGLKAVNDTYGHLSGDVVLQRVAHEMSSVLRPYDFLCRTGGDEFMIVFNVDLVQSQALGERLRTRVASSPIGLRQDNARVSVTLSIGLAQASPHANEMDVLKTADQAMYVAKRTKNSVVTADQSATEPAAKAAPV